MVSASARDDATQKLVDAIQNGREWMQEEEWEAAYPGDVRPGYDVIKKLVDAATAALEAAQRPPVSPEVREELVAHIHARAEFDSDECDHGTYTGGALHGQPYRMCERKADALLARFSFPSQPVYDEARNALSEWESFNRGLIASGATQPREIRALRSLLAWLRSGELTREETNE